MERDEADKVRAFIRSLMVNLKMNYGNAMALAGIDPELIWDVHRIAHQGTLDWLDNN